MPAALIKSKKRKKPRKPTLKSIDHKEGRDAMAGHEDRLDMFIKRTLELKRAGHYLEEIAEIIAKEYKLEKVPHFTTVAQWRKQGMGAVSEDIRDLQRELLFDQWSELQKLKAKWMPIALAQELEIKRWRMVEGSLQPEMDENAIKEQSEATKRVIEIMNREAKLLGLDLAQAATKDGEGPGSLQDLQLWMVGQININGPQNGGAVDIASEVLELRSGIEETDAI